MDYDFEKLAREIASSSEEPPAEIAAKFIMSSVQSTRDRQPPAETVTAVCRGVMSGQLLVGKDLSAAAVGILGKMAQLAGDLNLDPQEMMTWGMAGIADVAVIAPATAPYQIREAIDRQFMGAGSVFDELCQQAKAKRPAA